MRTALVVLALLAVLFLSAWVGCELAKVAGRYRRPRDKGGAP